MRAIQASLKIMADVSGKGAFASESIRRNAGDLSEKDLKLTTFLVYSVLRRKELWEYLLKFYLQTPFRKLEPVVKHTLLLGAAGILDVSGLPDEGNCERPLYSVSKKRGIPVPRDLVNAVLRRFSNSGRKLYQETLKKTTWKCQSLIHGVPLSPAPRVFKGKNPFGVAETS